MPKLTCLFSLATLGTFATFALPLAAQDAPRINEIIVVGAQDSHTVATDDTLVAPADTAQMLRKMPGANLNKNGELTGIAQYRGMFGDRISVAVDGAQISGAGHLAQHLGGVGRRDQRVVRCYRMAVLHTDHDDFINARCILSGKR